MPRYIGEECVRCVTTQQSPQRFKWCLGQCEAYVCVTVLSVDVSWFMGP